MRKALLGGVVVLVLILAMSGASTGQARVTLVFRQNDTPLEAAGLLAATQVWNNEHPAIQMRFETVPWSDARDVFIRESQAGGGPDVLQVAFVWTAEFARAGFLQNLTDLLKRDPPPNGVDDFIALELARLDGSVYGLPWTVDTHTIVYRTDVLEKAGIKKFPDTWEEFQQVAAALSKERGRFGFAFAAGASGINASSWFLFNYYLWSNGFDLVRKDPRAGTWDVGADTRTLADAIRYFKRFFELGATPESMIATPSWGDPTIVRGIQTGTFAMTIWVPATLQAVLKSDPGLPVASALIPKGKLRRISHLGGRTIAISAHSRYKNEAWEFVKYLSSRRVFERYYKEQFPAQRSLLREIQFKPPFKGFAEMLPIARSFYDYVVSPAPVGSMADATTRELNAVFSGQKDADAAARDLTAAIQQLLSRR